MFKKLDAYFKEFVCLIEQRFCKYIDVDEQIMDIGNKFVQEANRLMSEKSVEKIFIKLRYWPLIHQGGYDELMYKAVYSLGCCLTLDDCIKIFKNKIQRNIFI